MIVCSPVSPPAAGSVVAKPPGPSSVGAPGAARVPRVSESSTIKGHDTPTSRGFRGQRGHEEVAPPPDFALDHGGVAGRREERFHHAELAAHHGAERPPHDL